MADTPALDDNPTTNGSSTPAALNDESSATPSVDPTPASETVPDVPSDPTAVPNSEQDPASAPPQPPLPTSDTMPLPAIVDGIEPQDISDPPTATQRPSVAQVFTTLTAKVQRAVRLANLPVPPPPPTLFLFGDSLTELSVSASDPTAAPGWASLLREAYGDSADVLVRGLSGYNSRWALRVLPRSLRSALRAGNNVRIVSILLGTNDCCDPPVDQHVPLDEYVLNLDRMVRFVRELNVAPLLLTPPPVGSCPDPVVGGSVRQLAVVEKYARACIQVAENLGCPVINLYDGLLERAGPDALDDMFNDGLHFSRLGNQAVFDLFVKGLNSFFPHLAPSSLPRPFPSWSDIDPLNPGESLGDSELIDA